LHLAFHHDRPLPVIEYGGTERLIYWLMKELVKLGHRVTFIGPPKSRLSHLGIQQISWVPADGPWWEKTPDSVDLFHLFFNFEPPLGIPCLNTIGGNGQTKETFSLNTVFVSKKHAQNHNSTQFIYNSIDLEEYPRSKIISKDKLREWNRFLFLAKARWSVKNLKGTVRACRSTRKHLEICGGRSFIPSRWIHSHGLVGGEKKLEFMQKCSALLFPVRWDEPFGIAVIEAMALGLPVLASPHGSLPELIKSPAAKSPVGLILENEEQLVAALRDPKTFLEPGTEFDPLAIREFVEQNFSVERMASDYIQLYERILQKVTLTNHRPQWQPARNSKQLLPF
jgi:glycosyltransferase involved in cell wall biosynthesis